MFQTLTNYWKRFWQVPDPDREVPHEFHEFLDQVEQQPEFHVEVTNVQHWHTAIAALKPHSARGIDGISAAELQQLPPLAIEHLCGIMAAMSEFPPWIMVANTIALPKVSGEISAAQVRPITIFAQLYRTWSRVVSQQILARFATLMPSNITGFLKHRGPMDASMQLAYFLEQAFHENTTHSGVTMDLIKCFNTICRVSTTIVMKRLGIPVWLVDMWAASLDNMQRRWTLNRNISDLIDTNNGCPEGDSLSVIAMISLGFVWINAITRTDTGARPTCYADNWGWTVPEVSRHQVIMQLTQRFTKVTRMQIDWHKTWTWSTNLVSSQEVRDLFAQLLPNVELQHVRSAMDLGCQHTYRGCPTLGQYKERLVTAKSRITRIQKMPHELSVKTHLVMGGAFPAAFYGVELVPLGLQQITNFRSPVADAVLGPCQARNSTIAIACTPKLDDPVVYVVLKVLRTIQRFVRTLEPLERVEFFRLVVNHSAKGKDCRGPAGCLAYYLHMVDWELSEDGMLNLPTSLSLPLLTTSGKRLRFWLDQMRHDDLLTQCTQRDILHGLVINPHETKSVLACFDSKQQQQLLNEISGAFQTAHQKVQWAQDQTEQCAFCDDTDSRFHRLHECQAFQHVRGDHQDTLNYYASRELLIHELPVIFRHDDFHVLHTIAFQHVEACLSDHLHLKLRGLQQDGICLEFFTDGSLLFPQLPTARHGAYSVVLDTCTTDEERAQASRLYKSTGDMPPSLQTLAIARITGTQTIFRAELFAVVCLCEWLDNIKIYVDAKAVLDVISRCQHAASEGELYDCEDLDLVLRLFRTLPRGRYQFEKIQAHQDPGGITDDLLRYRVLGNKQANDTAILASKHMYPQVVQQWTAMAQDLVEQKDRLKDLFRLHLSLHEARAKQEQLDRQQDPDGEVATPPEDMLRKLQQWRISQPAPVGRLRIDGTSRSVLGPTLSKLFVHWAQQLRWPPDDEVPVGDPGITFMELAVNFMLFSGTYLPCRRAKRDGIMYYYLPSSQTDAEAQAVTLAEQGLFMSYIMHQMDQLRVPRLFPACAHVACKSLYWLGAKQMSKGLCKRPELPNQEDMVTLLGRMATSAGYGMTQKTVPLEVTAAVPKMRSELIDSISARQERVKREVAKIRKDAVGM
eukprot:Skav202721  [mRNA]  locus=scaffold654:963827:967240:+ [translate_table: standard]